MKTLILVRHAKSDWQHTGLSDHDRPLNPRGQSDAPRMGGFLATHYPPPQRIISSSALRARITAEALAKAFSDPPLEPHTLSELYLANMQTLLAQTQALDDGDGTVMLVGHNPGMTDFFNLLTDAGIDNLSTCAVARINLEVTHWSEVTPGQGNLLSLDTPKTLTSH